MSGATCFGRLALAEVTSVRSAGHTPALCAGVVLAGLADLSYHAAISSALGYGSALKAIDQHIYRSLQSGRP